MLTTIDVRPTGTAIGPTTLADRLRQARAAGFVGRRPEVALFRSTLSDRQAVVLYLWGPGGVGKSALLRRFADIARAAGRETVWLDARTIERTPAAFASAAARTGGSRPGAVLLIDSFEACQGMEGWFWDAFLPGLPADSHVVLTSRHRPAPGRHLDPDWSATVRQLRVGELNRAEALALLRARAVPESLHDALYGFAGGHPLALILAAEVAARDAGSVGRWHPHEPAIKTLLDRLVGELPSAAHRRALEICAHVLVTREDLLCRVFADQGPELFAWLRDQPFVEAHRHGLSPHDLVRDLLIADLRWRDPEGWRAVHDQVGPYFVERALNATGVDVLPSQLALTYLHRHGDLIGRFITWRGQGEVYEDAYRAADRDRVVAMAEQLDGRAGAALVDFWLRRQPEGFRVYRRPGADEPVAYVAWLRLEEPDELENRTDRLIGSLWAHAQETSPPRPGKRIAVQRFVNVEGLPPTPSPTSDLIHMRGFATCMREPDLAWSYIVMPNAGFWASALEYAGHDRLAGALDTVFAHDWAAIPIRAWLDQLQDRLLGGPGWSAPRTHKSAIFREDFRSAVRDVLRGWGHPRSVAANPLVNTPLAGHGDLSTRVEKLRSVIEEAVDTVRGTTRGDQLHRTLAATYFHGTATQEEAAERLGVAFGTYRHRLAAAIDYVTEDLWRRAGGAAG